MNVPHATRVKRYLSVILRWVFVGACVFALTVAGGDYITTNLLTKVYTATAILELPASELQTPTANANPDPVDLQPEFENTMMSPDFLLAVVRDLDLDKAWAKRVFDTDADELPDSDVLTHMEKSVKFEAKPGTNVIEIVASSNVPQEAADIANGIADHYMYLRETAATQPPREDGLQPNPVRILCRAVTPTEPSTPNKRFDFILTMVVAAFLSVTAASFVEIILLFLRAGERQGN
jgi:uncharacterized protein involved in exopolysaccharide biosynthesis